MENDAATEYVANMDGGRSAGGRVSVFIGVKLNAAPPVIW